MVMFLRFRELPDDQMKRILDYTNSGKPIVGLRTSTHAFNYTQRKDSPFAKYSYQDKIFEGGYGRQVFGETWINHYGVHQKESAGPDRAEENHPIVRACRISGAVGCVCVTLQGDCKPVILGQVLAG
jgi:hypothetical protein